MIFSIIEIIVTLPFRIICYILFIIFICLLILGKTVKYAFRFLRFLYRLLFVRKRRKKFKHSHVYVMYPPSKKSHLE